MLPEHQGRQEVMGLVARASERASDLWALPSAPIMFEETVLVVGVFDNDGCPGGRCRVAL